MSPSIPSAIMPSMAEFQDASRGAEGQWPTQSAEGMGSNDAKPYDLPEDFDFDAAAQQYGPIPDYLAMDGPAPGYGNGDNMMQMNNNHFSGDFEEALNAKTPGYQGFDTEAEYYPVSNSPYHQTTQAQDGLFQVQAPTTPFHESSDPLQTKTPNVAPTPYVSPILLMDDDMPITRIEEHGANPSSDFLPLPSPLTTEFPNSDEAGNSVPSTTTAKPKKTPKKTPTSRAKGKGKAKAAAAEDDEDAVMTSATTSGGKGQGRGRKAAAAKPATTTPTKKRTTATRKTAAKSAPVVDPLASMGPQRIRRPPKNGIAKFKAVPNSFDECDGADKALITMRDAGMSWGDIKIRYAELDGSTHGSSTIPNRYERLKTAFVSMREEDNLLLFEAKKDIEEDFNNRKWELIAENVKERGGEEGILYDPMDLKRRFKQLMGKNGFPADEGLARQDVDFNIGEADDEAEEGENQEEQGQVRKAPTIEWAGYEDEDEQEQAKQQHQQEQQQQQEPQQQHGGTGDQMDVDAEDEGDEELA